MRPSLIDSAIIRLSHFFFIALLVITGGCSTPAFQGAEGNALQTFDRTYKTDYETAWSSALDALKHSRLDVSNKEGGFIQTRWTENTAEKNFTDSFGPQDSYLKAQYRFRVTVAKAFYQKRPVIKISVQKEQLVQRDVLEGWRPIATENTEEFTLLYRIGRLITLKMKLAKIEQDRMNREMQESESLLK